jgi:hypothetical protein
MRIVLGKVKIPIKNEFLNVFLMVLSNLESTGNKCMVAKSTIIITVNNAILIQLEKRIAEKLRITTSPIKTAPTSSRISQIIVACLKFCLNDLK